MIEFQVIDATVAWMLSRIVPTIRRGHRFVSYSTTVVVCIPRALSVAVSLKNDTAPLLNMSHKQTKNAVLVEDK